MTSSQFKIAMQDWALSDPRKFTFRFKKKNNRTERATLLSVCTRIPDAPSKVNATYSVVKECVTVVVVVEEEHNFMRHRGRWERRRYVRTADPEAAAVLATEDREGVRRFHRFSVCPGVSCDAFEHCRCFLTMDGNYPSTFTFFRQYPLVPTTVR